MFLPYCRGELIDVVIVPCFALSRLGWFPHYQTYCLLFCCLYIRTHVQYKLHVRKRLPGCDPWFLKQLTPLRPEFNSCSVYRVSLQDHTHCMGYTHIIGSFCCPFGASFPARTPLACELCRYLWDEPDKVVVVGFKVLVPD